MYSSFEDIKQYQMKFGGKFYRIIFLAFTRVRAHALLNTQHTRAHTDTHTHTHTHTLTGALTTKIRVIFVFNFFQITYNLQATLAHNKLHYKCSSCSFAAPTSNLPALQNRNLIISFYPSYLDL
jgi:uncharacterized membrane protein YcgQ (UPF0703/DUF1980 family)